MARLRNGTQPRSAVMDDLHDARTSSGGEFARPVPVEFTAALVNLCSTELRQVRPAAWADALSDRSPMCSRAAPTITLNLIERTARTIYLSSDCAIGYEAGAMALTAIRGFVTILSTTSASTPVALTARPASRASRAVRRMSTFPVTFRSSRPAAMPMPSRSSAE
ncbi:MAG: hypothetical protein ACLTXI_03275 [Collinsella sp.]